MIVTLCGSNRFEPWFKAWNKALTLAGHEVFSISVYPSDEGTKKDWYTEEEKVVLDKVHKRKIDHADAVLFLNVFAYMGDSTLSELGHALGRKKDIFFLESWAKGNGIDGNHKLGERCAAEAYGCLGKYSPFDTHRFNCWPHEMFGVSGAARNRLVDIVNGPSSDWRSGREDL